MRFIKWRINMKAKKTKIKNQVDLVKKLPEPTDPNTVLEAPAPKDAPIPAPFPCWRRIRAIIATATKSKTTIAI